MWYLIDYSGGFKVEQWACGVVGGVEKFLVEEKGSFSNISTHFSSTIPNTEENKLGPLMHN